MGRNTLQRLRPQESLPGSHKQIKWHEGTATTVLRLQILFSLGIVLPNRANLGAGVFLRAVATSGKPLGHSTFADLTQIAAEYGFGAIHATSIAVYVLWQNGCIIQF